MSPALSRTVSEFEFYLPDGQALKAADSTNFTDTLSLDHHARGIAHIAKMYDGSQSHLLHCSDGFYVVKFPNNPQGNRILVNELICTTLARALDLPAPIGKIIQIDDEMISSQKITTEWGNGTTLSCSGLCFGSRHPGNRTLLFTHLPKDRMEDVENLPDLAGILLFDFWTSNADPREVLFFRKRGEWKMRAHMIDSGHCFRGSRWAFYDSCRFLPHPDSHYFSWITGREAFEPWLSRIEKLDESVMRDAWRMVPPEWYGTDLPALQQLLRQLSARRKSLRGALGVFHRNGGFGQGDASNAKIFCAADHLQTRSLVQEFEFSEVCRTTYPQSHLASRTNFGQECDSVREQRRFQSCRDLLRERTRSLRTASRIHPDARLDIRWAGPPIRDER